MTRRCSTQSVRFDRRSAFESLSRVIQHIFKEHASALLGRKADHEAFDSATKTQHRRVRGLYRIRTHGGSFRLDTHPALPQQIDTAIVGNPKKPRFKGTAVVILVQPENEGSSWFCVLCILINARTNQIQT